MTQSPSNPFDYHISTLLERDDRYAVEASRDEFEAVETTADEMVYMLDGKKASVVDDVDGRDGLYDNASAFLTENFDNQNPMVQRIDSSEDTHGYIAVYPDMENAATTQDQETVVAHVPASVAFIFDAQTQYDIKIE